MKIGYLVDYKRKIIVKRWGVSGVKHVRISFPLDNVFIDDEVRKIPKDLEYLLDSDKCPEEATEEYTMFTGGYIEPEVEDEGTNEFISVNAAYYQIKDWKSTYSGDWLPVIQKLKNYLEKNPHNCHGVIKYYRDNGEIITPNGKIRFTNIPEDEEDRKLANKLIDAMMHGDITGYIDISIFGTTARIMRVCSMKRVKYNGCNIFIHSDVPCRFNRTYFETTEVYNGTIIASEVYKGNVNKFRNGKIKEVILRDETEVYAPKNTWSRVGLVPFSDGLYDLRRADVSISISELAALDAPEKIKKYKVLDLGKPFTDIRFIEREAGYFKYMSENGFTLLVGEDKKVYVDGRDKTEVPPEIYKEADKIEDVVVLTKL